MTFSASVRDPNMHCFDKCKQVQACFKLINQFMAKPSVIKDPKNKKKLLNVQEVKRFLNLIVC